MANDTLSSGQIHFTGLGNGTDFDAVITKLIEVERTHINRLESWKAEWNDKVTAFQDVNTKMLALKTSLAGMDTVDEFLIKTAASSNSDILTASAGSSAQEGTHSILVNQLAQNDIWTHTTGHADTTTDITGGSASQFDYTYDGTTVSLSVPSGTSLTTLVDRINKDNDNPGVRASIIFDGTMYHMQLRGLDLGNAYDVTIQASTTLTGYQPTDFTHSQDDQSAQIRVDGYPPAGWIERSTNSIGDVISGLTLNLKSATGATPISITVDTDSEAVKEQVRTFVSQVNEVLTLIREQTKVDDNNKGSLLTGNYGLQMIQTNLKSILAQRGIGFDYDLDAVVSLASIGITTDADEGSVTIGQLLLDETALSEALDTDPEAVARLFSAKNEASTNSSDFVPFDEPYIVGVTQAGTYEIAYQVDGSGNIINATIAGIAATVDNTTHTITSSSGSAKGLTLEVRNLNLGSYTGNAYLKLGKTGELIDELSDLTNSTTGTLKVLERNYTDIMNNIDDKIAYEEARLTRMERDMRNRFARLESLLGYYENLTAYLTSQISSLSTNKS